MWDIDISQYQDAKSLWKFLKWLGINHLEYWRTHKSNYMYNTVLYWSKAESRCFRKLPNIQLPPVLPGVYIQRKRSFVRIPESCTTFKEDIKEAIPGDISYTLRFAWTIGQAWPKLVIGVSESFNCEETKLKTPAWRNGESGLLGYWATQYDFLLSLL